MADKKIKLEESFTPEVEIMDLLKFEHLRAETFTRSNFINVFMINYQRYGDNMERIANNMGISRPDLTATFRVLTGFSVRFLHDCCVAWNLQKELDRLDENHDARVDLMEQTLRDINATMAKNEIAQDREITKVKKQMLRMIHKQEKNPLDALAAKCGYGSGSGLLRFLLSKRYTDAARCLGLKPYIPPKVWR